jgi:hypothetical protein
MGKVKSQVNITTFSNAKVKSLIKVTDFSNAKSWKLSQSYRFWCSRVKVKLKLGTKNAITFKSYNLV